MLDFQSMVLGIPESPLPTREADPDGRVIMRGLGWWQFEAMRAIRGEEAGVRLSYLEGDLEIMSPSRTHEIINKSDIPRHQQAPTLRGARHPRVVGVA